MDTTTVNVIKCGEHSGFCREYYKNIENGNVYARQVSHKESGQDIYCWCSTSKDGEPDCNLKDGLVINIYSSNKKNIINTITLKYNDWWECSFEA